MYERDKDGYELTYSETVKSRSLIQALQYDIVKRTTINRYQELIEAWLPKNKSVIHFNNDSIMQGFEFNYNHSCPK